MQARSQEVRRGGGGGGGGGGESINTSESIIRGPKYESGEGGKSVRFPSRLAGQIRKERHLRAQCIFISTVTRRGGSQASNGGGGGGGGNPPLAMGLIRAYTYRSLDYLHVW